MLTINVVSNTLVTFENLFYSSWLSQSRERAIFNELGHLLFQFNQHANEHQKGLKNPPKYSIVRTL